MSIQLVVEFFLFHNSSVEVIAQQARVLAATCFVGIMIIMRYPLLLATVHIVHIFLGRHHDELTICKTGQYLKAALKLFRDAYKEERLHILFGISKQRCTKTGSDQLVLFVGHPESILV